MKKFITIISVVALVALLGVALVACGVPGNYREGMEKMEAAGYDINDSVSLNISGTYLAFRAYGDNGNLTAAYFPKADNAKAAEDYYAKVQKQSPDYTVKKKTVGNFIVVYSGPAAVVKDFEK